MRYLPVRLVAAGLACLLAVVFGCAGAHALVQAGMLVPPPFAVQVGPARLTGQIVRPAACFRHGCVPAAPQFSRTVDTYVVWVTFQYTGQRWWTKLLIEIPINPKRPFVVPSVD